ncbi:MAG: endonuclease MutS2 [Cyanobacteria bacterium J06635_1]
MIQAETLDLLEWPRLCQHLSTFAATKLGTLATRQVPIPTTQTDSERLLAQTREAYQLDNMTPLKFSGVRDIGDALERATLQGILSGDELLAIATTLAGARQLRRTIDAQEEDEFPVLQALVAELRTYPELEQTIHHCIDDRGKVTDRANPKLEGIRHQLKSVNEQIHSKLQQIVQRNSGALQETLITQRGDRYVIPVKAPQKDKIPGIVHDVSSTGATLFIEPQSVVGFGNQLRQLQRQETREEEIVRQQLTTQVAEVSEDLEQLMVIVTTLDLATARARYSLWLEANPPRFVASEEPTVLRQLRHPLLVWQHKHEQGPEVVPTDIVMRPDIRVVAITGPNTGGKTVTLKTLGLTALMAKIGLFIPAREPVELPWFDQILADIGDEQSIEQSLSTFSGHIRRIGRILAAIGEASSGGVSETMPDRATGRKAKGERLGSQELGVRSQESGEGGNGEGRGDGGTRGHGDGGDGGDGEDSNSLTITARLSARAEAHYPLPTTHYPLPANALVLLDEVGAGTDPSEGSALAIALLKYLADRSRLTIATTHFGELKALKYEDSRFENASVEFDDVSLSPTYRLLWGIPGRSNALTIARRLGLDPAVLDEAQTYVEGTQQTDVNEVIAGLEAQRKRQETKAEQAAQIVVQAEKLKAEIERKAMLLREREQALKQGQEQAVQSAIADAKAEIARVIRRLQKGDITAQGAQKATEAINQIAEKQLPMGKHPAKGRLGYRPKIGERVRLVSLGGQTAEVLSDPDTDGKLSVRFGLMKMVVDITDIESLSGQKAEPVEKPKAAPQPALTQPAVQSSGPAVRTSQNTIDLRGMRVVEAEPALDDFIARANGPIWIIHGHGTGKLKRGVQAYLKRHPQVERFEAADQADGGTGVTIAYL